MSTFHIVIVAVLAACLIAVVLAELELRRVRRIAEQNHLPMSVGRNGTRPRVYDWEREGDV